MKMEVLDATSLAERQAHEFRLQLDVRSQEKYPAKQHARRVGENLGADNGLIYLSGTSVTNIQNSEFDAPFRQQRYFYYLSGCDEPDCHLTYDLRRDVLVLFLPRADPRSVIYNGRGSTRAEALAKYDIDEAYYLDELPNYLRSLQVTMINLYVLGLDQALPAVLKKWPRVESAALQPAINVARMIKDQYEINLIRKANDISSEAHVAVLANIRKFTNEAQVEGLFLNECIIRQARLQAYTPIAASGPNAGTLHYSANNEDFGKRQLMCLDAGCEYKLHASDITRTFPLGGSWPSREAENIYNLVQRMQTACIKGLAPGVRYLDMHIRAHQVAIEGLLQLGLLHNGTKEEIYKAGTSRAFFPHGLGHHVGLNVHDVGQAELMSMRCGRSDREQVPSVYPESFHIPVYNAETCHAPTDPQSPHLEEGMIVTVEPGIYFSMYALRHFYLPSPVHSKYINMQVLQRYLPVGGVRIEDDLLIIANGCENLTKAPKGEEMLEIIRSGSTAKYYAARHRSQQHETRSPPRHSPVSAPGISTGTSDPIVKSMIRANTSPVESRRREGGDLEPFDGPSLFSNFARTMTTDENVERWRKSRGAAVPTSRSSQTKASLPVCGELISNVRHMYMNEASSTPTVANSRESSSSPKCQNCLILVQTLDRLRKNLKTSHAPQHPILDLPSGSSFAGKAPVNVPATTKSRPVPAQTTAPQTLPIRSSNPRTTTHTAPQTQSCQQPQMPLRKPELPSASNNAIKATTRTPALAPAPEQTSNELKASMQEMRAELDRLKKQMQSLEAGATSSRKQTPRRSHSFEIIEAPFDEQDPTSLI